MNKKISKLSIALLLIVMGLSTALAYNVLYTLKLSTTSKISVLGLQLISEGNQLPYQGPYDWGIFSLNQEKFMTVASSKAFYLTNIDFLNETVTWSTDADPTIWLVTITGWKSGTTKIIPPEANSPGFQISLKCINDTGGSYTININFDVVS